MTGAYFGLDNKAGRTLCHVYDPIFELHDSFLSRTKFQLCQASFTVQSRRGSEDRTGLNRPLDVERKF